MPRLRIGGHVTLKPDLPDDFTFQCFILNQRFHVTPSTIDKYKTFPKLDGPSFRIVHAGYVTVPWSDKEDVRAKSFVDIERSFPICERIGIPNFLVHLPATVLDEGAFVTQLKTIKEVHTGSTRFVLEGRAAKPGPGHVLSHDPIEVFHDYYRIVEKVFDGKIPYGFCLDTAHLFSQGLPLTTKEDAKHFINNIKDLPITVIHLNGNKTNRGCGRDAHAGVGELTDQIWGSDHSGVVEILKWCRAQDIPIILERPHQSFPEDYDNEIALLRHWLKYSRD